MACLKLNDYVTKRAPSPTVRLDYSLKIGLKWLPLWLPTTTIGKLQGANISYVSLGFNAKQHHKWYQRHFFEPKCFQYFIEIFIFYAKDVF